MTCGPCVKHVTAALKSLLGVTAVDVDLNAGRVRVTASSDTADFIEAMDDPGYPAQPANTSTAQGSIPVEKTGKGGCCCH